MALLRKILNILLSVILVASLVYFIHLIREPVRFDSEDWKKWEESEVVFSLRWDMMNSLRNNHNLIGMSKKEILELLGEPEWERNGSFVYNLGFAHSGFDTGSLTIEFNKEGKVEKFHVFRG